jgi:EspG family
VPGWTLSTVDIDVLVDALSLPPLPYPLDLPSPGATFGERGRHVAGVLAGLAERGLVDGSAVPGDLADALTLLATGELVVDGRLGRLDLVGVVRGDQAVLAMRTGDTVWVSLLPDGALVGVIVDLLPEVRQVSGNSTSVSHDALTKALTTLTHSTDFTEFERILTEAGVRHKDLRLLAELIRADGIAAQFGVALRTPVTDSYRERRVWTWYAAPAGGVLLSSDSTESPTWTTFVPADPARVGRYLRDALYSLRYGRTVEERL